MAADHVHDTAASRTVKISGRGLIRPLQQLRVMVGDIPCDIISEDASGSPSPWQLVFSQTAGAGMFEAGEWNKTAGGLNMAALHTLEQYRDKASKRFTFKMRWPGLTRYSNVWSQTSNPVRCGLPSGLHIAT